MQDDEEKFNTDLIRKDSLDADQLSINSTSTTEATNSSSTNSIFSNNSTTQNNNNAKKKGKNKKNKKEKAKKQTIQFSNEIHIKEYTKCTDSIRYIKKKNRRKASEEAKNEESPQNLVPEKTFKEITVKSKLKNSGESFTYNYPVTTLGLLK